MLQMTKIVQIQFHVLTHTLVKIISLTVVFLRISIQQTFMSCNGHMTLYHCDQNDHHKVRIILSCTLCVLHAIWLRNGTKSKQFHSFILISVEHCRPEPQATA